MKKTAKLISVLLSFLMVLTALPLWTAAVAPVKTGFCGDFPINAEFSLYPDGRLVISGSGRVKKIPDEIKNNIRKIEIEEGIAVISYSCFRDMQNLQEVSFPASLISVEVSAFSLCRKLETVNIPENSRLASIGNYAFEECATGSVSFPASLKEISGNAFHACPYLSEISFADFSQLEIIDSGAFSGCEKLTQVVIPASVRKIGSSAFYGCSALKKVSFGESSRLEAVSPGAFGECTSLESFAFPPSVKIIEQEAFKGTALKELSFGEASLLGKISDSAFSGCHELEAVSFPSGLSVIGKTAFKKCVKLKTAVFPEDSQLKVIDAAAFEDCQALSLKLPASVEKLGEFSFYNIKAMAVPSASGLRFIGDFALSFQADTKEIFIPASVEKIGDRAIIGCTALENIKVADGNTAYASLDGVLYSKDKTVLFSYPPAKSLKTYSVPSGTERLESHAFLQCANLEEIVLPESLKEAGLSAVDNCLSLKKINIPSGLKNSHLISVVPALEALVIPENNSLENFNMEQLKGTALYEGLPAGEIYFGDIFAGFKGSFPETVTVKEGTRVIGENALYNGINIKKINIPASVEIIDEQAFMKCSKAEFSIPENTEIRRIEPRAFAQTNFYLAFPAEPVYLGKVFMFDKAGSENLVIKDGTLSITAGALSNNDSLVSVSLPESLLSIGNSAFYDCSSLSSVEFRGSSSLETIEFMAFSKCPMLKEFTLPAGVKEISPYMMSLCTGLEKVRVSENSKLSLIGEEAFSGCEKLKEINLPGTVEVIEKKAFHQCISLSSPINLPAVRAIGESAFADCEELESVTLSPDKTEKIGSYAFAFSGVEEINAGKVLYDLGEYAFLNCMGLKAVGLTYETPLYSIPFGCFEACFSIDGITLPDSVRVIEMNALSDGNYEKINISENSELAVFENSSSFGGKLKELYFPSGLLYTDFSDNIFADAVNITVSPLNPCFASEDGVLYNKDKTTLILYPARKKAESFTVPSTVNSVSEAAFCGASVSGEIIIPQGVGYIKADTFESCNAEKIILPASVEYFAREAFSFCLKLKEIVLPGNTKLSYIDRDCFTFCSNLEKFFFPASLVYAERNIFYNATSLSAINTAAENPYYSSDNGVLYSKDKKILIKYPPLKNGTEYTVADGTEIIEGMAFLRSPLIESVSLPASVRVIDDRAFNDCKKLKSLNIPRDSKLTETGYSVFEGCSSLEKIFIPSGIENLPPDIFEKCTGLKEIKVSDKNPSYASDNGVLFSADKTILCQYPAAKEDRSFAVPSSVTKIEDNAFNDAAYLENIDIPAATVTAYFSFIFMNAEKLEKVNVHQDNPSFLSDDGVVYSKDKKSLYFYPSGKEDKNIVIPASVINIEYNAFSNIAFGESIEVESGNTMYISENGVLYTADKSDLLVYPPEKKDSSFTIGVTVEDFMDSGIESNPYLEKILVEKGHKNLSSHDGVLFSYKGIVIYPDGKKDEFWSVPEGTEQLFVGSFEENRNLKKLRLPPSVDMVMFNSLRDALSLRELIVENPECYIMPDASNTDFLITGYSNSESEVYAKINGLEFFPRGDMKKVPSSASTCSVPGCIEHYTSENGDRLYLDEFGFKVADPGDVALPLSPHKPDKKVISDEALKTPATLYSPAIYYYTCSVCGGISKDKTFTAGEALLAGDTDGDGKVLAGDARLALRAAVKLQELEKEELMRADIDGKEGITSADARLILRIAVKLESFKG